MSRIILALDGLEMSPERVISLVRSLKDDIWGVKLGDVLLGDNFALITHCRNWTRVMVDLKCHDIPFTVANHVKRIACYGPDILTVQASGGLKMLEEARKAAPMVKIAAVTVLTSMSEGECQAIYGKDRLSQVSYLAHVAREAGIDHIVCSVSELPLLLKMKENTDHPFKMIIPGYRPGGTVKGEDQVHVATHPFQVKEASYVVIGRPILQAPSPVEAAKAINQTLESP